jgi:pyruvate/2-oxoglutarate dehydrogenase complex dihydrolipoamide dehydrogenase (E3) component
MNWSPPPTIDPSLTAIATGLIGAISGYLAHRMGVKMKQVEKEPEIMKHLDNAVANIISHYTETLELEKVRHAEHVAEQDAKIYRAVSRISQLEDAMRSSGMTIPPHKP